MFSKLIVTALALLVLGVGTATAAETPQGLRADGLRWQGIADRYARLQGQKADGLRWQAIARSYAQPTATSASSEGFNWSDAGLGLAAGLGVAAAGGAAIVFARRSRRTKLAH